MSDEAADRLECIGQALFHSNGNEGVRAGTALYEQVIEGLMAFITRNREPRAEVLRFPPVMSRSQLEKSGYLGSFPHLLGCVSCLHGSEAEIRNVVEKRESGTDWAGALGATDLVLTPAACYPLYPLVAARRQTSPKPLMFDVASYCFRREATFELDRLQAFRMREFVCVGTGEQALDFRTRWISRAEELARQLGVQYHIASASDPFFGRVGKLAAMIQVEQALKFELLIPVLSEEQPTACMSFNYHRDHFGTTWELRTESGDVAHTACVAFGVDRLALALFAIHGTELAGWPASVREALLV